MTVSEASHNIRAVIVDDEIHARELIEGMLAEDEQITIVGQGHNGATAVKAIREKQPDLVFLDIQMPDFDGFEVIRKVGPERMPQVVFVTAYDQYAIDAFEINALDYLLKPFSRKRFAKAIQRAKEALSQDQVKNLTDKLMKLLKSRNDLEAAPAGSENSRYLTEVQVSTQNRMYTLKLNQVDLIESADHYVKLFSNGKSFLIHDSISNLEDQLNPTDFSRIHRTKIVRIKAITDIVKSGDRTYFVILADGSKHRISRRHLKKLPQLLPPIS